MISSASPSLASAGPSSAAGYQPQLDGLRGLAILSVLIHHFDVHIHLGPVGVRLFFLLSGYLITLSVWKLINPNHATGALWRGIGGFHLKRAARMLPVLYTMLGVGVLMGLPEIIDGLGWHVVFLTNFYTLAEDQWPGAASHLWSLSVQEQFYVLWPFFLLVVPRRVLPWALGGLILFAFMYRYYCWSTDSSVFMRWVMLPGVIDSFAMGALVACWKSAGRPFSVTEGWPKYAWAAAALGTYILARALRLFPTASPWLAVIETLENFALAWLLLRTIEGWKGWVGVILQHPWLIYIGKVSFGLYVFHVLIHVAFAPWLTEFGIHHSVVRAAILIFATLGVAAISWHSVEAPIAAWVRQRKRHPSQSRLPALHFSKESGEKPDSFL
jgi:peptidoglycan/LPS O-acetylase OafA/YrhL